MPIKNYARLKNGWIADVSFMKFKKKKKKEGKDGER